MIWVGHFKVHMQTQMREGKRGEGEKMKVGGKMKLKVFFGWEGQRGEERESNKITLVDTTIIYKKSKLL